ncbi:hypothetical protein C7999DRAFT_43363 [Corynascus novoguineensis]|uniref:DUF3752 domain-containing protein n=1 Tax=Corynascus novoguineensis TaxID=1126955 RepID=A0AAN7CMZ0_9PEZI|nr:hypothetical protein C7999DRAFT_43363 [Corynascus novoguineensis]
MTSIGPQLPPHLQKRKRSPDDETDSSSPPPKASRQSNEDEIALDDDSDDGFGPSAPNPLGNSDSEKSVSRPRPAIGPSLPPSAANNSTPVPQDENRSIGPSLSFTAAPPDNDEIPLDSDSDDNTGGPAPAPAKAGPAPPPKRILGPAPPPADLSERPTTDPDADSSEDDDWGPALPGASSAVSGRAPGTSFGPTRPSTVSDREPSAAAAPKRDDWMLAPPTSSGPRAPDPTKLRARKFASGPRAATGTDGKPAGVSSIWTETPEEKARRLANAVLGREDPNNSAPPASSATAARRGPEVGSGSRADVARVKSYVEQTRGSSLVEQHQAARAAGKASSAKLVKGGETAKWGVKGGGAGEGGDDEDDDPSKRAFDWEKDMKVGGQISNAQRRELLNRAANFGGRFQSGKYL